MLLLWRGTRRGLGPCLAVMEDYHVEKDIEESQPGSGEQAAGGKKAGRAPTMVKLGNEANTACNKRKKDGTTTNASKKGEKLQTAASVAPKAANFWW